MIPRWRSHSNQGISVFPWNCLANVAVGVGSRIMARISKTTGILLAWSLSLAAATANELDYFLPDGTPYASEITLPEDYLGYQVGEWHIRHDQLVGYLELLASQSPRLSLERVGVSHEKRPLVLLVATSEENHGRLEEIRKQHLQLGDPENEVKPGEDWPAVVHMGYSVHGDESSGSNAVPVVAYHLAAGRGQAVEKLLQETVILIDPCLNPDGFARFAQWANSHRGQQLVENAEHREHHAVWPGGRTNHYWFDLNRDWLLAQHPESQARLVKFHEWRPNVHTDYHEMGSETTYFFQPGVPQRKHPLTPEENVQWTQRFANEHAGALDQIRSLYFTEERFDDFYYGKGSTYPDIHGGVGILFEQASSRGHLRESPHGAFDFAFTIRNHVRTSLSTLKTAAANRQALLEYQRRFYSDALALASADPVKAYVFGESGDAGRELELLRLLQRHHVQVYQLGSDLTLNGRLFSADSSYIVPSRQAQYRLVRSMFETRTSFEDDIFYDVSTWTLPLAFGVPHGEWRDGLEESLLGDRWSEVKGAPQGSLRPTYAYAIEWKDYYAPKVLHALQQASVRVAVSTVPLTLPVAGAGERPFDRGTLIIPAARQELSENALARTLSEVARSASVKVYPIDTGLTSEGADLGSTRIPPLKPIAPALVVGSGVNHYEAGEIWHLLDHRMGITLPLLEMTTVPEVDLERYSHLLLADGSYGRWSGETVANIRQWIERGGILVAQKRAARWAAEKGLAKVHFGSQADHDHAKGEHDHEGERSHQVKPAKGLAYGDYEQIEDAKRTSGAIFRGQLDLSHPMAFGYERTDLPVFRNSNLVMQPSGNPYATPLRYADKGTLLSGYVHPDNLKNFKGSAGMIAEKVGGGAVILLCDNPNFRAFWYGTNKVYLNALFFGQVLRATEPRKHEDSAAAQDAHH